MKEQMSEFVRREIVLDAPRARVWALVHDPRELRTWLADEISLDRLEPGAEGVVDLQDGERRRVVVEEVQTERRIALRWAELDGPQPAHETLVELTLDDHPDGGTRLVVVELPLASVRAVSDAFAAGTGPSDPTMTVAAPPAPGPTMALAGCR